MNQYKENSKSFLEQISYMRDRLIEESQFKTNMINNIINSAAGTWTVFDGYTTQDSELNNEAVLNSNIEKYNNGNTNRQICHMDFSINSGIINYNTVYLRKRQFKTDWATRHFGNEIVLKDVNNQDINIKQDFKYDEGISGLIWGDGSGYVVKKQIEFNGSLKQLNDSISGVDISYHNYKNEFGSIDQELINWDLVKEEVDFILLRAGYGKGNIDKMFEHSYNQCKEKGIPVGAYWYSYASNKEEALIEAEEFLKVLNGKQLEYPVYFDFEKIEEEEYQKINQDRNKLGIAEEIIRTFIEKIRDNGYLCGLYYNMEYCNIGYTEYVTQLRDQKLLWRARWTEKSIINENTYGVAEGIWQWSNGETNQPEELKGFNSITSTDRNLCYYDYVGYIKAKGLNNFEASTEEKEFLNWR